MAQRRKGNGPNVLGRHERAAVTKRMNLAGEHQRLRRTGTRTVPHEALHQRRGVGRIGVAPEREANRVRLHRTRDRYRPGDLTHLEDLSPVHDAGHRNVHRLRRAVEDVVERRFRRIFHLQLEKEPVELCFGQRIRALHLDRVLRRQHQKRLLELKRRLAHGHADFLHRFEECGLCLGRRAVDLVGQHHVGEDRTGLELEKRPALGVLLDDVRADDVSGHQVRRELNAREPKVQHVREGVHQAGLADAGNTLEKHVTAREQARHGAGDDLLVSDDASPDLRGDSDKTFAK